MKSAIIHQCFASWDSSACDNYLHSTLWSTINYHLFLPLRMLLAEVMDRELSFAHKMSLKTLKSLETNIFPSTFINCHSYWEGSISFQTILLYSAKRYINIRQTIDYFAMQWAKHALVDLSVLSSWNRGTSWKQIESLCFQTQKELQTIRWAQYRFPLAN